MASTTNYSWTTPDDTGLVKDGASAIRTLGSSVDTTLKNLNPSTTLGDIEYRSSSANVNTRLAIGTTGQVLTVAGGVPTWAASAGGGKVLQVLQQVYSTEVYVNTATYTDTGLSLAITPSSSSSKILVFVNQNFTIVRSGSYATHRIKLLRNGTDVYEQLGAGYIYAASANPNLGLITPITYLDSPATTSSVTYKIQGRPDPVSPGDVTYQSSGTQNSTITLMEIGA
jgi:hypothetical protein